MESTPFQTFCSGISSGPGIIYGSGIICGPGSFAGLYRGNIQAWSARPSLRLSRLQKNVVWNGSQTPFKLSKSRDFSNSRQRRAWLSMVVDERKCAGIGKFEKLSRLKGLYRIWNPPLMDVVIKKVSFVFNESENKHASHTTPSSLKACIPAGNGTMTLRKVALAEYWLGTTFWVAFTVLCFCTFNDLS